MQLSIAQLETHRRLVFETTLPPLVWLGVAAAVLLLVLGLYRTELRTAPRWVAVLVSTSRAIACLVVLAAMAQPILLHRTTETHHPWLVVLVDDSSSMDLADAHASASHQFRWADSLGLLPDDARPIRLEGAAATLRATADLLRWMVRLSAFHVDSDAPGDAHTQIHSLADDVDAVVHDVVAASTHPTELPNLTRTGLAELGQRLRTRVVPVLQGSVDAPDRPSDGALFDSVIELLDASANQVAAIGESVDAYLAGRADADASRAMSEAAALTRRELAKRSLRRLTFAQGDATREQVHVRHFAFASSAHETSDGSPIGVETQPTTQDSETKDFDRQHTDLATALEVATQSQPDETIAGVLLITDGRHNTASDAVAAAERLGALGVPVFPLLLGSAEPPPDAAIVEISAPQTVFRDDAAVITASIKLDGLTGRDVQVQLLDAEGSVVDEQTLTAAGPRERREVTLSHKPQAVGRLRYAMQVSEWPDEVVADNNRRTFSIDIDDEPTRVLLVDGGPRWEYRYLRNLLLRDRSVKLQSVLFQPASIDNAPEIVPITANPENVDARADRLPVDAAGLNAFDVIIVGDVSANDFPYADQRLLEQFVAERAGTLCVVAGKAHMPADHVGLPLLDLLPVRESDSGFTTAPTADGFRIVLMAEGRDSPITSLHLDGDANHELWRGLPPVHWRSRWHVAKGGAQGLARIDTVWTNGSNDPAPSATQPANVERSQPTSDLLLSWHHYGLGKVLFVGWDATWRMRFKAGDRLHHRFWGQVLRWATQANLPQGIELVKIGTDRARYAQGEPVRVRARFMAADRTPLSDVLVSAEFRTGGETTRRGRLLHLPGSAGLYEASFDDLPSGEFEIDLDSPRIESLRQPSDPPGPVRTSITIDPAESAEWDDLSANPELLDRLAGVSGGRRITAANPDAFWSGLKTDPVRTVNESKTPLWSSAWLLIAFAAITTVEWVLRKQVGLI